MMLGIRLTRSGAAPFVPAPRGVRAGDYVFTSSIYPIDGAGHAIQVDEGLGEAGTSLIEAQTRHCLDSLKTVLTESEVRSIKCSRPTCTSRTPPSSTNSSESGVNTSPANRQHAPLN